MKPLEMLYWLRFVLGIVAAIICVFYSWATNRIFEGFEPSILLSGIAFALIIYMLSYYIIKPRFILKVDKPQKIRTTGIGTYLLSWIVFWVLLYTVILKLYAA